MINEMEHEPNLILTVDGGCVHVHNFYYPFTSTLVDYLSNGDVFEYFVKETYPYTLLESNRENFYLVYINGSPESNLVSHGDLSYFETSLFVHESYCEQVD